MRFPAAALTLVFLLTSSSARAATLRVPSEYPTMDEALNGYANGDTILIESDGLRGLVIGYGGVLDGPFEFTDIGSEALLLNGLQYFPLPRSNEQIVVTPEQKAAGEAVMETIAQAYEAIGDVQKEEKPEALARFLEESDKVISVEVRSGGVKVYWRDFPDVPNTIRADPDPLLKQAAGDIPEKRMVMHRHLVEEFWKVESRGGIVAFGSNYFTRGVNRVTAERTRAILQQLELGETVSRSEYEGTLLARGAIREDVLRAYGIEAGE